MPTSTPPDPFTPPTFCHWHDNILAKWIVHTLIARAIEASFTLNLRLNLGNRVGEVFILEKHTFPIVALENVMQISMLWMYFFSFIAFNLYLLVKFGLFIFFFMKSKS